ncbi:MAG: 2-nitropropane dioxygenase-like protein [Caulobacter sp.]|nr:2-nitropropane dioxygenase-like protein [Caulobacter sp.]
MTAAALFESLAIPIIQAPMLGASGPAMALAVTRAGGMGSLAAGGLAPEDIVEQIAALKAATDRPFGVNLLIARAAAPDPAIVTEALERLAPWHDRLGIELPAPPNDYAPDFDAQFAALLAAAPPLASFTFDVLNRDQVAALQAAGTLVVGTATTVAEARAWAAVGADAICAQGGEAGGHRGEFLKPGPESLIGTMALVVTVRAAVDLPVIAAGGIMDGRGVAAALSLGAAAAQMGTAFLLAEEATIGKPWRGRIESAPDDATAVTRAFTGRHARGIENDFMRALRPVEGEVPDYPVQNRLTRDMRAAGGRLGDSEVLSLWAGQGVSLTRAGSAADLVQAWWDEAREVSAALHARTHGPDGHRR